jgi:uncharacterized membrane protein
MEINMENTVDINKYIVKFGILYTIGIVVVTAILYAIDIDGNSGVSIAILMASAMYTAIKFIQDNKRIPNKSEKTKLVWSSLAVSWLLSVILFVALILFMEGFQGLAVISELIAELNTFLLLAILVLVSLIYLALLSWSYGGLAKKQYEKLLKTGKI